MVRRALRPPATLALLALVGLAATLTATLAGSLAGCVVDPTIQCGERVCPTGSLCIAEQCASPDAIDECIGKADGDLCPLGDRLGHCRDTFCQDTFCGDHVVDVGEACDDGNLTPGDGCSLDCLSLEVCGNEIIDVFASEDCDTGVPGLSGDGCSSTCLREDVEVRSLGGFQSQQARFGAPLSYDPDRREIIMLGGASDSQTWIWNTDRWSSRNTRPPNFQPSPSSAQGVSLYYDEAAQVTMFASAGQSQAGASTWLDHTWTLETAPPFGRAGFGGPIRNGTATCYDAGRGAGIFVGGVHVSGGVPTLINDAWSYAGGVWTALPTAPASRTGAAIAFAPDLGSDGAVILFGGHSVAADASTVLADTWRWDGVAWTELSPTGSPPSRAYHAMIYEPKLGRIVLLGGADGPANQADHELADAWSWDDAANTWIPEPELALPVPLAEHGLTYDASTGKLVVFGGRTTIAGVHVLGTNDTWTSTGGSWILASSGRLPSFNSGLFEALADRTTGEVILVGGSPTVALETWRYNHRYFAPGAVAPPELSPRRNFRIAGDPDGPGTVLFGGTAPDGSELDDTWRLTAAGWTEVVGAGPPARRDPAMATDPDRAAIVVFGGSRASEGGGRARLADTWVLEQGAWRLASSSGPPARELAAMAWDPTQHAVILFGGRDGATYFRDTWRWDGSAWTELTPPARPPARAGHRLVFDPTRRQLVSFGGEDDVAERSDAWEWTGTTWTPVITTGTLFPRALVTVFYDLERRVWLLTGGRRSQGLLGALLDQLTRGSPFAPADACHAAEDTDNDGLLGCADPDCWGRCDPTCPPGSEPATCAADRPRCGDTLCQLLEGADLCPGDCAVSPL